MKSNGIAVDAVIAFEHARGWEVESVEKDNRGFDLISRRPHPEDPKTAIEVRFIEVKGRSAVGEVALTTNEYQNCPAPQEGLLALRCLQLCWYTGDQRGSRPGTTRLAAHREDRALPS